MMYLTLSIIPAVIALALIAGGVIMLIAGNRSSQEKHRIILRIFGILSICTGTVISLILIAFWVYYFLNE